MTIIMFVEYLLQLLHIYFNQLQRSVFIAGTFIAAYPHFNVICRWTVQYGMKPMVLNEEHSMWNCWDTGHYHPKVYGP